MRQRATVLVWVLVLIALAGTVTTAMIAEQRRVLQAQRLFNEQQQAREWALGAAALSRGSEIEIDGWTLQHGDDGSLRATHSTGQGWHIEGADGLPGAEQRLPAPGSGSQP